MESEFAVRGDQEVCSLTGMKKVNTKAYHSQTDGLVENFNLTLCSMLAKYSKKLGDQWLVIYSSCCLPTEQIHIK